MPPPPEAARAAREGLHIKLVGLARIAPDVMPALAAATIGSITVLGSLQVSDGVDAPRRHRSAKVAGVEAPL
ncbi:hypothetical protein [Acuticoccus yangtzensis]|uniref:hypothetical protein n=1 Tax=Acuticoccus yangtzensis TaxID=1443441 RepID=UPI003CCBBCA6